MNTGTNDSVTPIAQIVKRSKGRPRTTVQVKMVKNPVTIEQKIFQEAKV